MYTPSSVTLTSPPRFSISGASSSVQIAISTSTSSSTSFARTGVKGGDEEVLRYGRGADRGGGRGARVEENPKRDGEGSSSESLSSGSGFPILVSLSPAFRLPVFSPSPSSSDELSRIEIVILLFCFKKSDAGFATLPCADGSGGLRLDGGSGLGVGRAYFVSK